VVLVRVEIGGQGRRHGRASAAEGEISGILEHAL
jgi:hypothetical protein